MGLIDQLKSAFGGKNDITGQRIQLKVCMMGPRAAGKTTILTSIFHDSDKVLPTAGLYFKPMGNTMTTLKKGYDDLCEIFEHIPDESATPLPGVKASKEKTTFDFQLGLKGQGNKDKRTSVDVNITDFPGEMVDETHPNHTEVLEFIKQSHVMMVAIDAVHLMEEDGRFNEVRNRSQYMCEKISGMLEQLDKDERKLILFVPLKCEKYAVEQKMHDVSARVMKAYQPLIQDVEENYKNRIGLFIVPIQTLGGVVFDKFGRDTSGNILLNAEDNNCPSDVRFKFFRAIPDRKPVYMPAYCVQPLYYLIAFALSEYKAEKGKGGVFSSFFKGLFGLFSSDLDFYQACRNFVANIKTTGQGFVVINNPNMIKI